jgi:putative oxidoreductase
MLENFLKKHTDCLYFIFRVIVGLVFSIHGAQKFGLLGGPGLMGFAGFAGIPVWLAAIVASIELVGGILIALGLLTRLAAASASVVMLYALVFVHKFKLIGQGNGELALVYLAAFIALFAFGARSYGVEKAVVGKEAF